jgi:hypothetical protein
MNLIQITEQLKNPAITVPQLMQYANNSNPQVPSYVALAEMQRRQSMQAPAQAPQETVKDQLGAQLMGLPSVAPQQSPQQPQQQPPQQPQGQQPQGIQTAPMPDSKSALPTQPGMTPGMAGGGLTSIPLDMHHDFASGGIIAFADGGYPAGYEIPEKMTEEQARIEREKAKQTYGFGGDPYAEAKRRYAEIEAKQKEAEKGAGFDRVISSLAAMGAGGPRQFGDVMASYANTSTNIEKERRKEAEQNAMKMAELHTLWGKEQDALKRAEYEAVMGRVDKSRAAQAEALTARRQFDQVKASTTSAEASAKQAATQANKEAFDQANYPKEFELKQQEVRAKVANALQKPGELQIIDNIYSALKAKDPKASYLDAVESYKMAGAGVNKSGVLTYKDALEQASKNPLLKGDALIQEAKRLMAGQSGGVAGLPKPSTSKNPYSDKSDAEIKAALGIK